MKNTNDAKQELLNAIGSNTPRQSVGGIAINLGNRGGGSSGPTTYTKSVVNNETNHELTVTNVENGVQKTPYKINYGGEAPIQAITDYDGNQLVPDQSKVVKLPDFVLPSDLATVATSGSYNDLLDKPIIPHQAIEIVESDYDPTKISENYLTYFTQGINNGPFFKVGQIAIQMLKSGDHYDGEITSVSESNGTLVFTRHNQPDLIYNPFAIILNKFYPVGTVYFSVNGNIDPNTEFGGVWLMIPDGWYIKSCDNVLTVPNIYLPASLPPVYGSAIWERNGKYSTDTYIVDGGFKIIGNFAINGSSSQSGTSCPVVAFDAAWNTNYANNPYREHGVMGENGLVDVAHFTCMVWVRQLNNEAKQKQIDLILNEWDKQIEQCNKEVSQAKAILSTNTQKMSIKKATITEEEKLAIEKENDIRNNIVENRNLCIEEINKKMEIFKKLNGVK